MGDSESLVMNIWPDVARALNLSRATAYALVNQGRIPSVRLGRRLVVPKAALQRMLDEAGSSKEV